MTDRPGRRAGGWWLCLVLALFSATPVVAFAPPGMVPDLDETAVEAAGNAQSDALLDCYAKFQGPNLDAHVLGPPRITRTNDGAYVLRADFLEEGAEGIGRLMCLSNGLVTRKELPIPPLYPAGATAADPATESAIAGWRSRKRAAQIAAMTMKRFPAPNAAAIGQLKGVWLLGSQPDKGPCLAHWYKQTEIEFEFEKTGGRALIYEPNDLFTPIKIAGIERSGDVLSIQAEARDGGLHLFMRIRPVAADRLEVLPPAGASVPSQQVAYKCGEANRSVTRDVTIDRLSLIEPPITGGSSLLEADPDVSDADLCSGNGLTRAELFKRSKLGFLQFEVYGPVHYWVLGLGFKPQYKFEFDFIRSIEDRGEKGLVLHMQRREKSDGWDAVSARGKTYDLTVVPRGNRIEIPELATSFVRCEPSDPAGAGMHRW